MITMILIGLAAGAASALMFASIISGALISLLLFYLTPLPLMVAALGWGPLSALIGGIAASLGTGVMFGLPHCLAVAVAIALPACWLGYLVLLGRPLTNEARDGAAADALELEWYPLGRILLWIAAFATLTTFATLLTFGSNTTTITATMGRGLVELFAGIGAKVDDRVIEALIAIIPICLVMGAFMVLTLNLWLAATITATSGRLRRPWPELRSAALPSMTLVTLCVAVALCFTGGLTALLAKIITSALMMAYAFTGFAVLHTLTLALKSRVFWLGSTYAIVLLFVWPLLAVVALGVADAVFGLRVRFLRSRPPPLLTP